MTISEKKVVQMHYTLKSTQGEVLDSSAGREPLAYIQGIGNIIPGLEKQLEGKVVGDKVQAVVAPEEAYGEKQDALVQVVPKAGFQGDADEVLQEGMQVQVQTNQGAQIATVTKIAGDDVTLDLNHPLAGETLHFDVEIVEVRDATSEELDHGHVHGPGGHQH